MSRIRARSRATVVVAILIAAFWSLAGCGNSDNSPDSLPTTSSAGDDTAFPVSIEHFYGETTISARPKRIVALGSTDFEILYALGVVPVGIATYPGFGATNEDGIQPWVEPYVDATVTTFLPDGDQSVEQIAALDPDLILMTYGTLGENSYRQLSRIAPTVGSPGGDWTLDWRLQLRTVARAVGMTDTAENLEAQLSNGIGELRTAHPELDGKTFSFVEVHPEGIWAYLSGDPRNGLIQELGLLPSPGIRALDESTGGKFVGDVSYELAGEIDADIIVVQAPSQSAQSIRDAPIFGELNTVKSGAAILYGKDDLAFLGSMVPSPLTIPAFTQRFVTDASEAATHIR